MGCVFMKFKGELKTEFDDFARAISDVLETDVIITDADMNVVGSAFQYFSLYQDIKIGSLIAEVFYANKDVLLEHKRDKESCRQCPEYHNCKMCADPTGSPDHRRDCPDSAEGPGQSPV